MRTGNPVTNRMGNYVSGDDVNIGEEAIEGRSSYLGVAVKTLYFLALISLSAIVSAWLLFTYTNVALMGLVVSIVVVLICGLLSSFIPKTIPVTGTLYALGQGFMVGAVSALVGAVYGGIVFTALLATILTAGVMMALHAFGIVRAGSRVRTFIFTALCSAALMGMVLLVLFFIPSTNAYFYVYPIIMIPLCVLMILVGCAYLLIDLNNIDTAVKGGLPKEYEWQSSFGLILSLLWLYIEFLRLLMILAALFGKKK